MFKKNMKGAVFALIAAATLTGTAAPVFAADPTSFNDSTASTVSGTNNETFTAGSDASQGQVGKEGSVTFGGTTSKPTETSPTNNVSVYATKASSVQVKIPQILIGNSTTSTYHVGVKGDVTTKQSVTVAPSAASFVLKDSNDPTNENRNVTATITSGKTNWTYAELFGSTGKAADGYIYGKSEIKYPSLHAGQYNGAFNLAVSLNYSAK